VVRGLREAGSRAAEFGVVLGVQNHHDIAVGYQSMKDLIEQVGHENCRAMFDAWAPALHGDDLRAAADLLGPLTIHTTVADYQLRPRYRYRPECINYEPQTPYAQAVPMGDGFIEYPAFFEALFTAGFSGSIGYEMCSPLLEGGELRTLDEYARRFVEYMVPARGELARAGTNS
jgi:sugar phosphate isomerase/epimerase